jgi:hypothetical protein
MGSCRPDVILLNWRCRICDRVNPRALRMGLLLQFVKEISGSLLWASGKVWSAASPAFIILIRRTVSALGGGALFRGAERELV